MSDTCGDVAYTDAEALYPGTDITEILPEEQQKVTVAVRRPRTMRTPMCRSHM
ncbi:MAG: hypothetical protein ACLT29_00500 [Ruminococcus callidus]